ncbi:hypothetical protein DITRI_Ditri08aG0128100 [Diplodiscus trichospermus]
MDPRSFIVLSECFSEASGRFMWPLLYPYGKTSGVLAYALMMFVKISQSCSKCYQGLFLPGIGEVTFDCLSEYHGLGRHKLLQDFVFTLVARLWDAYCAMIFHALSYGLYHL